MSRINPDIGGTSRQPRGLVKIGPWNGTVQMDAWISLEVVNNNLSSADTFRVRLAVSMLPPDFDANWFSQQKDMYAEVYMGFPDDATNFTASDLTQLILGQVDGIEYDPGLRQITLFGRDLTRVFIDTKSTQKYPNLTSSQIATQLAKAHGLTANVTPTSTPVGKFYEIDHVTMTDERSDWDLLLYLAGVEGYVVYVRGQTLYFNPKPSAKTDELYVIEWNQPTSDVNVPESNVKCIEFSRGLTVSRGVQVVIRSWNHKQAKGFTSFYPGHAKSIQVGQSTPFGGAQVYTRTFPNLTQDQADQKAKELYAAIVAHEMKFHADLPGDVILDTTSAIQVTGTETAYDQNYFPDVISRHMDFEGGFHMSVSAKNHAPDTAATL